MPTTNQSQPWFAWRNTTEALIMMAKGTQLPPRGSRTQSRHQPEMEGRRLMDHVAFERPDDGDEFDEPEVTGG